MGTDESGAQVAFVAVESAVVRSLSTAFDTVDGLAYRRASSLESLVALDDPPHCVVIGTDDERPGSRIEQVVETADTAVVAVHDGPLGDETLDRLTTAGAADVLTTEGLDGRATLAARRIEQLARARRTIRADRSSQGTRADGRHVGSDDAVAAERLQRDRAFLYSFLDVTMDPEASFDEQASALLELCCETLGFEMGVLSRVSDDDYEIRSVHAPGEHIAAGATFDLDGTYCKRVVDSASVEWFLDAADAGAVEKRAYCEMGMESYLGLPVTVGEGLYGTVCLASEEPRTDPVTDADVALFRLVAEWVGSDLLRARRQRELEALTDRLESLVEAIPLAVVGVSDDWTVTRWNPGAEAMFGYEAEEVVGEDYPLVPAAESADAEEMRRRTFDDEQYHGKSIRRLTRDGDVLDLRLSTAPFRTADGDVGEVYGVMDDVTELREFERKLRALQTTTSELNVAADAEEIRRVAVDAAADVLGYPLAAFWRYDEDDQCLDPTTRSEAARERLGRLPVLGPDDERLWSAFRAGECVLYDDLSVVDPTYQGVRSGIAVPIGDHGVLGAGSPVEDEYDEQDLELVRILGAAAEAALTRADRERRLRETNERLDEFASVVAHDLRTPLTAAVGFLDIARETGDDEHFDRIKDAHDRMTDLIEDLLALARTTDRTL
ncbi:GAF domain-containing protein, partial [Halomarina oriensis]